MIAKLFQVGLVFNFWKCTNAFLFQSSFGQLHPGGHAMISLQRYSAKQNHNGFSDGKAGSSWFRNSTTTIYPSPSGPKEFHSGSKSNLPPLSTGNLGDLMSRIASERGELSEKALSAGLVTSPGALEKRFGIENPLDRMLVTANGNLQRIISSYYDSAVEVVVDTSGTFVRESDDQYHSKTWDRLVHLTVHNQTFCTAKSVITVRDPMCVQLVESGQLGIAQLFRFFDILPDFELHNAGYHETGGLWRDYTLRCAELTCEIHEDFSECLWNLEVPRSDGLKFPPL